MRLQRSGIAVGILALVAAVAVVASPASAATTTQWATWQPLTGSAGAYATSVRLTPDATMIAAVTSTSRSGQVGVIPGASTWLSEGTPVGAKYGSSRDQPYLNLRPQADTPTGASTTTYSFLDPTPTAGWTFVLGDIDADAVRIQATGPDGQALGAEQLGFRGGFNYCAPGVVGKPSCTGSATDVPTWDPATLTLTGNAAAVDTSGAAAWFEPSAPITTLSFIYTRRSGLPVYQTWFASLARDVSGTVVDDGGVPQAGVSLSLTDEYGRVIAGATTAADGTYAFPGILGSDGYTVRVSAPEGMIADGGASRPVDLSETDAVDIDFVVRDIIPVAVSGRVVDQNGDGVDGVRVTIDGTDLAAITESDGRYLFDTVPVGDHVVRVTPTPGFSTIDDTRSISVPDDSEEPIVIPPEEDFVLQTNADLSGVVTSPATSTGVMGALISVTDAGGTVVATTTTRPLGVYTIPRVPPGEYIVTVTPPNGYGPLGPISADVDLGTESLTDVNFELAVLGSFSGTVRDASGNPLAGVGLTLEGPGGMRQLVSAEDGTFGLAGLAPGEYLLIVIPPEGTQAVDFGRRSFGFPPEGGGPFTMQDFVIAAMAVEPTPTPTPTPEPPTSAPAPGTGGGSAGTGSLPGTGLGPETFAWAAGGAVVLLLGATLLIVSRRRAAQRDSQRDEG